MGTLIGLMGLSRSALDAEQNAINVTATNVANQNVAGYTRQTVSFSDTDSVSLSSSSNSGQWVTSSATSQRDRVLDQRLQQATSQSSASTARLSALQSVESSFGLSDTNANASSTQLGSALDSFFASLTALTANPSDATTRSSVLTAASTLASAFRTAASSLSSATSTLNVQIATQAQGIDALTSQIAHLNGQITSLSSNANTDALQDQRQQAVQQLSQILGVNVISNENNGITLTASNGAVLVSGTDSYSVSTTMVDGNTEIVAGLPPSLQSGITGGSIGGMLEARDSDLPQLSSQLDQLANAVGTAMNQQNAMGTTISGATGGAIFSLPPTVADAAAQIGVTTSDPAAIAAAGAGEGINGTTNAIALSAIASNTIVGGQTASSFYARFIGTLGNIVAGATTAQSSDAAATTQAQTTRDSFSAVSLDDEASQLQQFQRGYEAAAKVFSIINEIMGAAINLGTATTV